MARCRNYAIGDRSLPAYACGHIELTPGAEPVSLHRGLSLNLLHVPSVQCMAGAVLPLDGGRLTALVLADGIQLGSAPGIWCRDT